MTSPAMSPEKILQSLTCRYLTDGPLPKGALKEASRRRDEMLPLFLNEIEKYLSASAKARDLSPTPVMLIFFLLGEWGDKRAYRPIARLIRCPQFTDRVSFEDAFDRAGHRVIAGVFDGDPEPLFEAVRDKNAHRIARYLILVNAIAMLAHQEKIDREAVANFLIDLYELLDDRPIVWLGWATLAAYLGLSAIRPLVLQAIADERFDAYEIDEFDADVKRATERSGAVPSNEDFSPFESAYEELKAILP